MKRACDTAVAYKQWSCFQELKGDIVVLGSGMGNAAAMSLLEGKGVDADTVQQLLLPEEEDWCCSQLHQAAHQAGVHLQVRKRETTCAGHTVLCRAM